MRARNSAKKDTCEAQQLHGAYGVKLSVESPYIRKNRSKYFETGKKGSIPTYYPLNFGQML
jgi:hypothetical protein